MYMQDSNFPKPYSLSSSPLSSFFFIYIFLPPIGPPLQVEVQRVHAAVEHASIAKPGVLLPFSIDDLERDIFVRRACVEADDNEVLVVGLFQVELRGLGAVDQVWIENRELVANDLLGRRVFLVVMSRIVLVPRISRAHDIDELGLPGAILV